MKFKDGIYFKCYNRDYFKNDIDGWIYEVNTNGKYCIYGQDDWISTTFNVDQKHLKDILTPCDCYDVIYLGKIDDK